MTEPTTNAHPTPEPAPTRYLTRIRLENFQSHRDTDVQLAPGINLITGSSDAGKSAILRAIHWLFHNQPKTKSFIRRRTNECRVTVYFSDGTVVQRIKGIGGRGKSEMNAYIVSYPGEHEPRRYERFGHEVPEEVQKALGNPPIDERHGAVSYAEQLAPYFLVSLTAGELPRALSELTGIQDYEEAAQLLGREANSAEKLMKAAQERVAIHEDRLAQYDSLAEEMSTLTQLETQYADLTETSNRLSAGRNLLNEWKTVNAEGMKASTAAKSCAAIATLQEQVEPLVSVRDRFARGIRILREFAELQAEEAAAAQAIDRCAAIEALAPAVRDARQMWEVARRKREFQAEASEVTKAIAAAEHQQEGAIHRLDSLEAEKRQITGEMRALGLWCEACNRPFIREEKETSDAC